MQTFFQFTSNTFLSEDHPKAQKAPCGKTLIPPLPAFLQLKILRQDFPDNFAAEIFIAYWSLYRASQEKELTECCCNHGAKAQSPVAGIPCVWKLFFFLPLLPRTKQFQVILMGEFGPAALKFGQDFFCYFILGHTPCIRWRSSLLQYDNCDHDDRYSRGDDVENVVTRLLGQLCPTAMEFSEVKPFDRQKLFPLSCRQLVFSSFLLSYASPIIESKRYLFLIGQESARTQSQNAEWPYLFN